VAYVMSFLQQWGRRCKVGSAVLETAWGALLKQLKRGLSRKVRMQARRLCGRFRLKDRDL
jgi:hypothetical protein